MVSGAISTSPFGHLTEYRRADLGLGDQLGHQRRRRLVQVRQNARLCRRQRAFRLVGRAFYPSHDQPPFESDRRFAGAGRDADQSHVFQFTRNLPWVFPEAVRRQIIEPNRATDFRQPRQQASVPGAGRNRTGLHGLASVFSEVNPVFEADIETGRQGHLEGLAPRRIVVVGDPLGELQNLIVDDRCFVNPVGNVLDGGGLPRRFGRQRRRELLVDGDDIPDQGLASKGNDNPAARPGHGVVRRRDAVGVGLGHGRRYCHFGVEFRGSRERFRHGTQALPGSSGARRGTVWEARAPTRRQPVGQWSVFVL